MVVHSFPVQPLRKDSSKASTHIWMTQRLEAGVREIVGGGFIPVFSCAWTVPVGMQLIQLKQKKKKTQHKKTLIINLIIAELLVKLGDYLRFEVFNWSGLSK